MAGTPPQQLTPAMLLRLQQGDAGNLYWRGRRINAARDFAIVSMLVATILAVRQSAVWWP